MEIALTERAAAHTHFLDLCKLFEHDDPVSNLMISRCQKSGTSFGQSFMIPSGYDQRKLGLASQIRGRHTGSVGGSTPRQGKAFGNAWRNIGVI
jgi:hypothetical protein